MASSPTSNGASFVSQPSEQPTKLNNRAAFIWSVADLLRGDYKPHEWGKVILPLTVIRRLDCALQPTKAKVLETHARFGDRDPLLRAAAGEVQFYNTSKLDLGRVVRDSANLAATLRSYIASFSPTARDILEKFGFDTQIDRLDDANLLYLVLSRFASLDLSPVSVSNVEMGYLYEELIRRSSELSNETAGEHFTPREVIRLMVDLLLVDDGDTLRKPGIVRTLFDPACGTGGMLSVAQDRVRELNGDAILETFGQEVNDETYAVCRSDMIIKGQDAGNIADGNSFTEDAFRGKKYDYMLANPPFGVEWKKVADLIKKEHKTRGFYGRFGAGLPKINDGALLFLQHMLSKRKHPGDGGSRIAIVFNGSALFSGDPNSGPSEIRRWIIENDWLEAIVALPDQLFYNTPISTFFWIVTSRKSSDRRGYVQLVDARSHFQMLMKNLGKKRKRIAESQIAEIVEIYGCFADGPHSKIVANEEFGSQVITIERPLRLSWTLNDQTIKRLKRSELLAQYREDTASRLADSLRSEASAKKLVEEKMRFHVQGAMAVVGLSGADVCDEILKCLAVRDEEAAAQTDSRGRALPDAYLRDTEAVPFPAGKLVFEEDVTRRLKSPPFRESVDTYMAQEVLPHVPDAWVDYAKTRISYQIPFARYFYKYQPPRPLADIDAEILQLEEAIRKGIGGILS